MTAPEHWVGLVRAVMVGREGLTRDVLLGTFRAAGARDARSHLATGTVSFATRDVHGVVDAAEESLERLLGRPTLVAVRPLEAVRDLLAGDAFAGVDPAAWETEAAFVRHDAPPIVPERLGDPRRTVVVALTERELLTARPRTGGQRPHANRLLERAAGGPATSRGWSTLERVVDALSAAGPGDGPRGRARGRRPTTSDAP